MRIIFSIAIFFIGFQSAAYEEGACVPRLRAGFEHITFKAGTARSWLRKVDVVRMFSNTRGLVGAIQDWKYAGTHGPKVTSKFPMEYVPITRPRDDSEQIQQSLAAAEWLASKRTFVAMMGYPQMFSAAGGYAAFFMGRDPKERGPGGNAGTRIGSFYVPNFSYTGVLLVELGPSPRVRKFYELDRDASLSGRWNDQQQDLLYALLNADLQELTGGR
jgi:hypothetical protein